MKKTNNENYALLVDFYELTMANGYFLTDKKDEIVYFDLFFGTFPTKAAMRFCGTGASHRIYRKPAFYRRRYRLSSFQEPLRRRFSGIFERLPFYGRYLCDTGRNRGLSGRTVNHGQSQSNRSATGRNIFAFNNQPPIFDCHQSQPDYAGGGRKSGV